MWREKMIYILRCMRLHPDTAQLALHWLPLVSVSSEGGECLSISPQTAPHQSKQKQIRPRAAVSWFISSVPTLCVYVYHSVYLQTIQTCYSEGNMILAHSLNSHRWIINKISLNQSQEIFHPYTWRDRQNISTISKLD